MYGVTQSALRNEQEASLKARRAARQAGWDDVLDGFPPDPNLSTLTEKFPQVQPEVIAASYAAGRRDVPALAIR